MKQQKSACRRIVVSDDNPKLVAHIVATLRDAGHCVFAAYDADSACELTLAIPEVDLMITNTRVGGITDRELIRAVREQRPDLPILHVGVRLANPDGLLDDVPHLDEPFTGDELMAVVNSLLSPRETRA
jgi:DNA-binding response OmpR family regulator